MSAIGIAKNVVIGEALVTVFEPLVLCRKCKQRKPKSDFRNYQTCADCREEARRYQSERARQHEEKRREELRAKKEREELFDKCCELHPKEDEWETFNRWHWYYNDVVEGTGKFVELIEEDFCSPQFNMQLWFELLTIWNNLGRPKAPEDWEPEV